jgi:hypothetical protein
MKRRIINELVIMGGIVGAMSGCGRDAPPEGSEYKVPPAIVFGESAVPEPASLSGTPAPPPKPVPTAAPVKVAAPVQAMQKVPEPVKKVESAAPSIIGTWLVSEMSRNGQAMPLPPGMQITFTFAEGGSLTMSVSGEKIPQGKNDQQGSYTLNGEQFTMTMHNKPSSGTCRFEGNDRVTLDMTEAKMVLTRM